MTDPFPPVHHWPVLSAPDCPTCQTHTEVVYTGLADRLDGGQATVWHCRPCSTDFAILATRWPVTEGPDCPYCGTDATTWAAIEPDRMGDLWLCGYGHEFVLTPEGLIVPPGGEAA
ncbi:hypothetical protein [Spirillospora sp. NPDC029432]|uniref:hypothetical protein n=1 Tax=Spirillospora sp. NPDC029432 TaxID=3154599 RepID=UPI003453EF83